jgi:hypothetical protein
MMRRLWRWFLARFHLSDRVVCEMSEGLPPHADYHDYPDSEGGYPDHFATLRCKRCGKEFTI